MEEGARRAALAELYTLPGHLLWRAAARVNVEVGRILPGGTDIHSYAALVALADQEPQTQSHLARMCGVSGTTLTTVAGALEREGLVERVRNPDDRRSYMLTRTTVGRSAVRRWAPHVRRIEDRLTAGFTAGDTARLHQLMLQVIGDQLEPRTLPALLSSTGFLVTHAHHRAHRDFMAVLRPLGIEPRHYGTIRALRIMGPATQGQLGTVLDVSAATVVQVVDHLEQRGLVERRRDESDRRAYRLHLTSEADTVVAAATETAEALNDELFGTARSRQRRDGVRLLTAMLTGPDSGSPSAPS